MTAPDTPGSADAVVAAVRVLVPELDVAAARRSSAGASRETWTLEGPEGEPVAVLQRALAGPGRPDDAWLAEAELLRRVRAHGVAAPEVLGAGRGDDALGRPWILTRHLSGETIPRRILRDERFAGARRRFVVDVAGQLAALHAVPVDELPPLPADDPLDSWMAIHRALARPVPAFEIAARHLAMTRPETGPRALVHGDFRLGNLLVDDGGLVAVLDWELAHLGDPAEDLGWLCVRSWRFGGPRPVAGLAERRDLLDAYAAAGG
ncbi:MAG: phosphotransferase family protein, partial [Actinomyces sp.]